MKRVMQLTFCYKLIKLFIMKKERLLKVYDINTNETIKLFWNRIDACNYMDKIDPKCERLRVRCK